MKYNGSENAITHLGRTFRTSGRSEMTDEEWKEIIDYLYRRPDFSDVAREFNNLSKGGTKTTNITRYYLIDLIYKTRNREDAWSVDEAKSCKSVWEYFKWKVERSPKTFTDSYLGDSIEAALRLCGVRCCRKVPNFPIKVMDSLLERYLPDGGRYYDFSCGWSHRMLSALKHGVTYLGTDPNTELVDRLNDMSNDYRDCTGELVSIEINPTGSEVFHQQWTDSVDFCFSSPPYFNLELYSSENQSCGDGTDYFSWLTGWWADTVLNIHSYLKNGAVFAFNIKDLKPSNTYGDYPGISLCDDMVSIVEATGCFNRLEDFQMSNGKRPFAYKTGKEYSEEKIVVFEKR